MCRLSVNINKIATLRNSRGGNNPNLLQAALKIEEFGAEGITIHPRPDERHIRYQDARDLKTNIKTELNIEGNCLEKKFVDLVLEVKPEQVTLVPDIPGQLTSNHGWDTIKHKSYLQDMTHLFHEAGIRVSIFVDPDPKMVEGAALTGTDRVELYTEAYAKTYLKNPQEAIKPYVEAAQIAKQTSLGLNAGHDLDLQNLAFFVRHIENLLEVSIGHAVISDSLYFGLENTIKKYLSEVQKGLN